MATEVERITRAIIDSHGRWACRAVMDDGGICGKLLGIWEDGWLTVIEHGETYKVRGTLIRRCGRRECRAKHEIDTAHIEQIQRPKAGPNIVS